MTYFAFLNSQNRCEIAVAVSLSRRECFSICRRVVIKRSEVTSRACRWMGGMADLHLHTTDKTRQTCSSEEELSQDLRKGGRQAGWEWKTRQKNTNSPKRGPSFLRGIKVDVRSQNPPQLTSHVLLTSLCSSQSGLERFSHQMLTILTSAVCLASESVCWSCDWTNSSQIYERKKTNIKNWSA